MTYTKSDKDRDEKILGIDKRSEISDIKKAYKNKAREIHPDQSKKERTTAEEEFKELNQAYANLIRDRETQTNRKNSVHPDQWATQRFHQSFDLDLNSFLRVIDEFLFANVFDSPFPNFSPPRKRRFFNQDDTCESGHLPTTICLRCK